MYKKSPLYLQFRKSGYTFRYSLPKDVRSIFNRREVKFALRTYAFEQARYYSRQMACVIDSLIKSIRAGGVMAKLSDKQIDEIVNRYFTEICDYDEKIRSQGGWGEDAITMFREGRQATIENLIKCNHGVGKTLATDYLPEGMEHDEDDPSFSKLYREILKAAIRYHDVAIRREQGDYSNDPSIIDAAFQPIANQTVAQPLPIGNNNRTVSDIIDIYVDECCSTNRCRGASNEPRDVSIYLIRSLRAEPLTQIAPLFNLNHYSSVSSAVLRIKNRVARERKLKKRLDTIKAVLNKRQTET